ncbi:MAG: hypothetical protein DCC43_13410 [Candidatus Brocadia sp.]|nr:hypothetical protein [Candidatus Brocadia fulgida]MCC6325671.1 hypothetical protein [Candidatus Brocadia sp.]MCE7912535.1 hypothetical protein [Candidatus Brocadia sp. AMX3]MDG5997734.1 hypothetical protein [Candidatus Brocadia sp.]RIJ92738.1 MAG: hypothetical protein DCC43_13410 [Candidatus Brocadia sp.]
MTKFAFKKGFCGLALALVVVLVQGQISFAGEMGEIQKSMSIRVIHDEGNFGLARVRFSGEAGRELKRLMNSRQSTAESEQSVMEPSVMGSGNPVDVYAAYTSFQANTDPLQNAYWPWVYSDQAYLYVAFKVSAATRVSIRWSLYKDDANQAGYNWGFHSRSNWNFDLLTLDPDEWYFAWWHPSGADTPLTDGYYRLSTRVSIPSGGGRGNSRCTFQVVPLPLPE